MRRMIGAARRRSIDEEVGDELAVAGRDGVAVEVRLPVRGQQRVVDVEVAAVLRVARVQVRGGKAQVLDGPFAEAKEMIGGFFLLDVNTREEALAIASRCPAAEWATVEVRETAPCYV